MGLGDYWGYLHGWTGWIGFWVLFGRVESLTLDPLSISPWEGEGDELAGEGKKVLADSYVLWVGRPRWGARPTDVGPSPCWWATTRIAPTS